jgi:hypothetical protein
MTKETKNERFRRLAEIRGNRILRDLDLLGNLANRNNYEYTEDEAQKLFAAIDDQLKVTKFLFFHGNSRRKREIKL